MGNNITKTLNNLSKADTYSLMLFALWRMRDNLPEYSTLSELSYVLDNDNLIKFLDFYGGLTITIPTKDELNTMINALMLYQQVNLEHRTFKECLVEFTQNANIDEIKKAYVEIAKILDGCTFWKQEKDKKADEFNNNNT